MVAEISLFIDFSRWRPSTILDFWNVYLDHPRRVLGALYSCAKFGWNRQSSFDNTQLFLFCHFGLKMPIHTPKIGVLEEFDPPFGEPYQRNPENAHPCVRPRRLSHRPSTSGDGSDLWSCLKKGIYKGKNNFRYISPICLDAPRGRICTKFSTAPAYPPVISVLAIGWKMSILQGVEICPSPITRPN